MQKIGKAVFREAAGELLWSRHAHSKLCYSRNVMACMGASVANRSLKRLNLYIIEGCQWWPRNE